MQNRREFLRLLGAGAAGAVALSTPLSVFAADDLVHLTILHTNDFHSHIDPFGNDVPRNAGEGGMSRRAALISKIRSESEHVLLFDAGDIFQGTPYFNYFKAKLDFELMTMMGYDAATLGNHEFDNGLEGIRSQLKYAGFPFINSNYDFSDTILAGMTIPYKIFRCGVVKVGVYGLGVELQGLVDPKNYGNTRYNDPLQTALKMEKMLKEEHNTDLIFCLSHLGYSYKDNTVSDKVLAAQTFATDLIIGGHTHTFLAKPDLILNKSGKEVIVNQVGFGGLILGKIDFYLSKQKKIRKNKSVAIPVK
ncbi:MAG: metallophosphatase [Bacteroidia bacterium]|nr:metallophosphatase [Bacteroidia bacterium]